MPPARTAGPLHTHELRRREASIRPDRRGRRGPPHAAVAAGARRPRVCGGTRAARRGHRDDPALGRWRHSRRKPFGGSGAAIMAIRLGARPARSRRHHAASLHAYSRSSRCVPKRHPPGEGTGDEVRPRGGVQDRRSAGPPCRHSRGSRPRVRRARRARWPAGVRGHAGGRRRGSRRAFHRLGARPRPDRRAGRPAVVARRLNRPGDRTAPAAGKKSRRRAAVGGPVLHRARRRPARLF